jgi:hypothetical protein
MDAIVLPIDHIEGPFGAGVFEAEAAGFGPDALAALVGQFGLEVNAFGVAAPLAAQGTALEKHRGANAGAIVGAEVLNVENQPGGLF